ncbi:MAG: FAD-binding oxidoreductase [Chloroflexi bacterium]|nr:FAD-binding oxidoreductase [Chloroflexota bacterium]
MAANFMTVPWPAPHYVEDLPQIADVVVIGGGIVGAATAFFACKAGLRVVLLEKRPALCTLTTPASTGAFRLQFDNPEEIALVREGIELFEQFADRTELDGYDLGLRKQGYLFCATSDVGVAHQRHFVEALHGWGVRDVELLTGDEARYRFSYLSQDIVQARFRASDGWLDPKWLTFGYARASGAAIVLNTTATGFVRQGDRVVGVQTPRGTIACESAVVAAGPFAAQVAALAGLRLDLRPTIRHKLVIPELPALPADGPMTIHEETAAHWRPGLRGCYGLFTDPRTPAGEPLDNVPTSADFAFRLLDPRSPTSLARLSPLWESAWDDGSLYWLLQAGQYTYTADHRPLLGPSDVDGLVLNCGYSGHGIMASAGGSRMTVDAMLGRLSENPFRPQRQMLERPLDIL